MLEGVFVIQEEVCVIHTHESSSSYCEMEEIGEIPLNEMK
jgi:hypothetical protein